MGAPCAMAHMFSMLDHFPMRAGGLYDITFLYFP